MEGSHSVLASKSSLSDNVKHTTLVNLLSSLNVIVFWVTIKRPRLIHYFPLGVSGLTKQCYTVESLRRSTSLTPLGERESLSQEIL